MDKPIISNNADVMGGAPVFFGTRVPVQTLLDYLEAGETIDDFLEGFPSVTKEQVVAFLEEAKNQFVAAALCRLFSMNGLVGGCPAIPSVPIIRADRAACRNRQKHKLGALALQESKCRLYL